MSASVILSKQLQTESSELKEHISKFFDEKAKEFATSMKEKMDGFVDRKLTSYYHEPETSPFKEFNICPTRVDSPGGNGFGSVSYGPLYTFMFYEKTYTVTTISGGQPPTVRTETHHLNRNELDALKYVCSPSVSYDCIMRMMGISKYFKPKSSEFETTCREEYALIESKKQELDALLEEQQQKKEYYAELEEKIKKVELKEKELEIERQKLSEERSYLLEVKRKLVLMKEEVEKEKAQIKSVNLDDFH